MIIMMKIDAFNINKDRDKHNIIEERMTLSRMQIIANFTRPMIYH